MIHLYHSGQPNIPQLPAAGGAGALAALIYACGVTGFGVRVLDSLTRSGTVATATCAAGLQLADGVDGMPHIIEIAGSANGWNGKYLLSAAPGATSCTFAVPDSLPATATGTTITIKRAGAGMSRLYSADFQEVYRFADPLTMPGYLLLDDSGTQTAAAWLAETAASTVAFNTMSGLCPSSAQASGGARWRKTDGTGTANRPFVLLIWPGGLYLCVAWQGGYPLLHDPGYAGACLSRVPVDGYPGLIVGHTGVPSQLGHYHGFAYKDGMAQAGQWLQRSYSQMGGPIGCTKTGMAFGTRLGSGVYPAPNPVDGLLDAWGPIALSEGGSNENAPVRGAMPGLWDVVNGQELPTLDFLEDLPSLPGRKLAIVVCGQGTTAYRLALDCVGPY